MSQEALPTSLPAETPIEPPAVDAMQNDPLLILIMFGASVYLAWLWWQDAQTAKNGKPNPRAFPGAVFCSGAAIGVAVVGALVILGLEVAGEYALDLVGQQRNITALSLLAILSAAFFEELIFRGYLVVKNKGRAALIGSIVGFSLIFTLAHNYFWTLDFPEGVPGWQFWNGELSFDFGLKAWFSSAFFFINSLWFYAVRFYKLNPAQSLLPCVAAHFASNLGVFLIKLFQGHVVGLW